MSDSALIIESRTAKLARLRLESTKKYLPVREVVKLQLQKHQEAQVKFTEGT
ncbi:hypothetical protein ACJMK2_036047 [Sinanodonta woodiana]|uniref:Uncharacterized protein n=1 Tax=Sinanodonta woodiana TaxID=1069815 RepID=A0ABD3WHN5_SINWO